MMSIPSASGELFSSFIVSLQTMQQSRLISGLLSSLAAAFISPSPSKRQAFEQASSQIRRALHPAGDQDQRDYLVRKTLRIASGSSLSMLPSLNTHSVNAGCSVPCRQATRINELATVKGHSFLKIRTPPGATKLNNAWR